MSYPSHRWTDSRGEEQEEELVPSEQGQLPEPSLIEAAHEAKLREREAMDSFPVIPPVDRVCTGCCYVWHSSESSTCPNCEVVA